MDYNYNKKRVKWYWWVLLTVYCAGVVYWVLWSDPYLYSQVEFQKALVGRKSNTPQTIKSKTLVPEDAEFKQEKLSQFLWGNERTGADPTEVTRNRRFIEEANFPLTLPEDFELDSLVSNSQGVILVGKNGFVGAFDWEGAPQWKFTPPENLSFFRPLVLDQQVILAARKGQVYSLSRDKGELQWYLHLAQENFSEPILNGKSFLIAVRPWTREINGPQKEEDPKEEFKDDLSPGIAEVDLRTGKWLSISQPLAIEKEVSWSMKAKNTLFLAQGKNLLQLELPSLTVKQKKDFEADIISPVVVNGDDVIVPTRDGRVFGLKSNFEVRFESDLGQALSVPPILVPIHNRLAMITSNGYLHVITADKGERKWRFNLQNESPSHLGWTTRLNGKHIEQLNLGWVYKGWSLWVPCVKDRICIYNPAEGQIIDRILLTGSYVGVPYVKEKTFFFVLKQDKQWKISRVIEKSQTEKTSTEATSSAN